MWTRKPSNTDIFYVKNRIKLLEGGTERKDATPRKTNGS